MLYKMASTLTPRPVPPTAVVIPVHPYENSSPMTHSSKTPMFPTPPAIGHTSITLMKNIAC